MLRKFINKRLSLGFNELKIPYNQEDPWKTLVYEDAHGSKSSFKHVLDHTFYLPRDIITIFKNIGNKNLKLPISYNDMNMLLKEYSKEKKNEIVDELVVLYDKDAIDKIFVILNAVYKNRDTSFQEIMKMLEDYGLNTNDFHNLIDYCLLVPVDKYGHMFYNYREQAISYDFDKYTYRIHKVLSCYFNCK